jgi:hypothetical protein
LAAQAGATSVPRLSFEELTDHSELIIGGEITRSWSDWDVENKVIWTHHELNVTSLQKGAASSIVVVSEPGGVVGNRAMAIAGAVAYRPGDQVVLFLQRMPNGYLRTTGWGQGKYALDKKGVLHTDSAVRGVEIVSVDVAAKSSATQSTSLSALDGLSLAEFRVKVMARVAAQRRGSAK